MKTNTTSKTQATVNSFNLREGMDVTENLYSDRYCYYITKVLGPKSFQAKGYHVCGDHDKISGMGHQDRKFFKTVKEMETYLKKYFPDTTYECKQDDKEYDVEFVYRYNNWYTVNTDKNGKKTYNKVDLTLDCRNYYYDWGF